VAVTTRRRRGQTNVRELGLCKLERIVRISLSSPQKSAKRNNKKVLRCTAAEEIQTEKPIELPIFPLPLVLFPGTK